MSTVNEVSRCNLVQSVACKKRPREDADDEGPPTKRPPPNTNTMPLLSVNPIQDLIALFDKAADEHSDLFQKRNLEGPWEVRKHVIIPTHVQPNKLMEEGVLHPHFVARNTSVATLFHSVFGRAKVSKVPLTAICSGPDRKSTRLNSSH